MSRIRRDLIWTEYGPALGKDAKVIVLSLFYVLYCWSNVVLQVIGANNVAVPTHLFKVVVAENAGEIPLVAAFVVPNQPIDSNRLLTGYQVSLEMVEFYTGFVLLPSLNRRQVRNLCSVEACDLRHFVSVQKRAVQYRDEKYRAKG